MVDGKILKASEDGQPQTLPAPPDGVLERAAVDDRGVVAAAMVETDGEGPSLATSSLHTSMGRRRGRVLGPHCGVGTDGPHALVGGIAPHTSRLPSTSDSEWLALRFTHVGKVQTSEGPLRDLTSRKLTLWLRRDVGSPLRYVDRRPVPENPQAPPRKTCVGLS